MESISHITPLAINSLGGRYTQTQTRIQTSAQKQFKEIRHMPGFKMATEFYAPQYLKLLLRKAI